MIDVKKKEKQGERIIAIISYKNHRNRGFINMKLAGGR